MDYRILTAGDSAVSIEFGNSIDPLICTTARAARMKIEGARIKGITELIQTYCCVMVQYDPRVILYDDLCEKLHSLMADVDLSAVAGEKVIMEIPVCYGGEYGPDMENVCSHTGLSEADVIRLHSEPDYQIYMMGFLPGFVYLGGMNEVLETPRLKSPREKLDAGAVGIAGKQTGMYPMESPGGWQIIGRTPLKLYDPDRETPILYESGEYLKFVPISEEKYNEIKKLVDLNEYVYEKRKEG
ncbi:MAG: 5-oxoprolinase subunit PxpB [Lachnospiraceae bacterium]|nr:5-oxoprolinase subunit PxpB [Lachnospiraceae bacterium]